MVKINIIRLPLNFLFIVHEDEVLIWVYGLC